MVLFWFCSVLVLFSSEKSLSVQFSVLKKWGENWTELNFGNTKLTPAELESLAILDRCTSLEVDLITIHTQLTATKDTLNESLAHEANL